MTNASRIVSYVVIRVLRYDDVAMVDLRVQDMDLVVDMRGTLPWVPAPPPDEEPEPVAESDGTFSPTTKTLGESDVILTTAFEKLVKCWWTSGWPELHLVVLSPVNLALELVHITFSLLELVTVQVLDFFEWLQDLFGWTDAQLEIVLTIVCEMLVEGSGRMEYTAALALFNFGVGCFIVADSFIYAPPPFASVPLLIAVAAGAAASLSSTALMFQASNIAIEITRGYGTSVWLWALLWFNAVGFLLGTFVTWAWAVGLVTRVGSIASRVFSLLGLALTGAYVLGLYPATAAGLLTRVYLVTQLACIALVIWSYWTLAGTT
ncbi:MAG: hypothetical protein HXY34_12070 [Candidatus Thorarchaeota archaeon]|nr:hypothetical protein [Candidatus Thorarchaeota archaeon]